MEVSEGDGMITRAYTVAFQGIQARQVEMQCAVTAGMPAFSIGGCYCKPFFEDYVLGGLGFKH